MHSTTFWSILRIIFNLRVFCNDGLVHLTAQQLDTVHFFNVGNIMIYFMVVADLVSFDAVSKLLIYTKSGSE